MSDTFIILDEPTVTDKKLDAENVDGGTPPLVRERIQVTGAALAEVARVENTAPASTDYGLATRTYTFPNISGGNPTTNAHVVAAGTGAGDRGTVKSSPGQLYGVHVFNAAAYTVYVKIHDSASAITPGTTPVVRTIGVQAGTQRDVSVLHGLTLTVGFGYSIVKGIADGDATAIAANDCVVDFDYK